MKIVEYISTENSKTNANEKEVNCKDGVFSRFEIQPDGSYMPKEENSKEKLTRLDNGAWEHEVQTDFTTETHVFKIDEKNNIKTFVRKIIDKMTGAEIEVIYDSNGNVMPIRINNKGIKSGETQEDISLHYPEMDSSFSFFYKYGTEHVSFEYWKTPDVDGIQKQIERTYQIYKENEERLINETHITKIKTENCTTMDAVEYDTSMYDGKTYWREVHHIYEIESNKKTGKVTISTIVPPKKYVIDFSFVAKSETKEEVECSPIKLIIMHYSGDILLEEICEGSDDEGKTVIRQSLSVSIRNADGSYRRITEIADNQVLLCPEIIEFDIVPPNKDFIATITEESLDDMLGFLTEK